MINLKKINIIFLIKTNNSINAIFNNNYIKIISINF